jgi:hypothetical protein
MLQKRAGAPDTDISTIAIPTNEQHELLRDTSRILPWCSPRQSTLGKVHKEVHERLIRALSSSIMRVGVIALGRRFSAR